jgi:hypothetical protein
MKSLFYTASLVSLIALISQAFVSYATPPSYLETLLLPFILLIFSLFWIGLTRANLGFFSIYFNFFALIYIISFLIIFGA